MCQDGWTELDNLFYYLTRDFSAVPGQDRFKDSGNAKILGFLA